MKRANRMVAAGALVAMGLCGWSRAQVLEQVPSKAVGVFEVKDLQGMSGKLAKFAKTLGVDQFDPRWADPLASLMDTMDLKQGVNKNGDMAIAFFAPKDKAEAAGKNANEPDANEPPLVVLVPTDDYKSFLGNFTDVKDVGGEVSQATVAKNHETLFIISRGKYAVAAKDKTLLSDHGGIKLTGPAAKEAQSKDAIIFVDVAALRPEMEKGMKQARETINQQAAKPNADGAAADPANPLANPQMKKMLDMYMNLGERLAKETRAATFSFNLTDTGIATAAVGEFEPDSDLGKMMAKVKNTDKPLATGLPDATYFVFGGAQLTPEVTAELFTNFVEPIAQNAAGDPHAADLTKAIASMKEAMGATTSMSFGYTAKDGAAGDGIMSLISVAHGDANKILESNKAALPAMSSIMGMTGGKTTAEVQMGEPKTVDGVSLQPYTMKLNFDAKDPGGAQAQQMISMIYGRNGLEGFLGAVTPDTFMMVQGGDDKLVSNVIASSKKNDATLEEAAGVKLVANELPKQRAIEYYVALDNIATAGVKFAKQQGLAVPFKLPANLPPIGVSGGTEGATVRFDAVIPTQLVQSITAAAMQAFMQMQGGPGAGKGGGI